MPHIPSHPPNFGQPPPPAPAPVPQIDPKTGKPKKKSYFENVNELNEGAVASLDAQLKTAEKGIGTAAQAGEAARLQARRKAADQLSSYRGVGEGGRGMAMGMEAAQKASLTEGTILAATAKDVTEEAERVGTARTDVAIAKKKLLEQDQIWKAEDVDAAADIQAQLKVLNDNTLYTNLEDVQAVYDALYAKYQAANTPGAKAAYAQAMLNLQYGNGDFGGVDTWKMSASKLRTKPLTQET